MNPSSSAGGGGGSLAPGGGGGAPVAVLNALQLGMPRKPRSVEEEMKVFASYPGFLPSAGMKQRTGGGYNSSRGDQERF